VTKNERTTRGFVQVWLDGINSAANQYWAKVPAWRNAIEQQNKQSTKNRNWSWRYGRTEF